jgi:hypothetical protein
MRREELIELHYITPIENLPSILKWGIQSHRRASKVQHATIALQDIQDIRKNVRVPGGRELHEYANLYICARNPMMHRRKEQHRDICVLRIAPAALDIEGAIITDRNAATRIVRFAPSPDGLANVNRDLVFAEDWRHPFDQIAYKNHRAVKCAEVLIPDRVPPVYILGACVSCVDTQTRVKILVPDLDLVVDAHIFFCEEDEWFAF